MSGGPLAGLRETLAPERGRLAGLAFVRVGPLRDEAGPPLVLVPGLNDPLHSVADSWWFPRVVARYARRFAARRPVYYVSQPRSPEETASIAAVARSYEPAVEAIARRHAPPALVGLSMGGFLVGELAAARPDVLDRVALGLAADRVDRDSGRALLCRWDDHAAAGRWRAIYREAADVVARGPLRLAMRVAGDLYDLVRSPSQPGAFHRAVRACLDYGGRRALERVAGTDVPALVVGGDRDPFFSDAAFDRAAGLAGGRRVRLRNAAHDAVLSGDAFTRVLRRFLASPAT